MTRRILLSSVLALSMLIGTVRPAHAVSDEQIQQKIKELVDQIVAAQNADGIWEPKDKEKGEGHAGKGQWGGMTALQTYALLSAGVSYQDKRLTRAIEFLKTADIQGTYAIAIRAHVWAALPKEFNQYLQNDIYWLLEAIGAGPAKGGYDYTKTPNVDRVDNSVTQYGVLGVWEGAKRGSAVGKAYWTKVENHFVQLQNADGGWGYGEHRSESYGSMVAAGIAILHITQDYLHTDDFQTVGRTADHPLQKRINAGLEWIGKNFRPDQNPPGGQHGWVHYYLYGVERIGLASGYKYFNKRDWYQDGAEFLMRNSGKDENAAFSLLFLVRGRVPIFINKLEIPGYDWNNRPRDVANLTQWVADEVENKMNWQIISIENRAEEWLDSPILYLASHKELALTEEQAQQIKRYIDLGGLLITSADDSKPQFTNSLTALMKQLYPQYEMQQVADDDDIFKMNFKIDKNRSGVQSIHNGIRHLVLHFPRDISWTFHKGSMRDPAQWQLMANIYQYATERGRIRNRLDVHYERRNKTGGGPEVKIARGKYEGNWDPEPLAWEMQGTYMHNRDKASATITEVPLSELSGAEASFVHVTGTEAVQFSDADIAGVKAFVEGGGVILFETAGGVGDFTDSVRAMLHKAFPGNPARPINLQSPIITGKEINGFDVSSIHYRNYAVLRMGRLNTPRIQAVNFDGQPRILISPEDMTEAMLNQPVWGVFGYHPQSARDLMTNMVVWAHKVNPK